MTLDGNSNPHEDVKTSKEIYMGQYKRQYKYIFCL